MSNYVALPGAGGYDEQDAALMDDFHVLAAWVNWQTHRFQRQSSRQTRLPGMNEVFKG